jgi:putative peptidoglycan lipid II flippase
MILGAIAMLVVTVGPLLRTGFRYTPAIDFRDDRARTVFTVFAALLIFALLDRLNQISNRYFASLVGDGAISALEFGWRFELPISHVLSSSVALPSLAMMALQAAGNQVQALRKTVTISLGLIAILVVPLIGFLVVLREPLTALWLQHGAFSAHDSALVSSLLPALSVSYLMRALGTVTVYGLLILRQLKALLGILVLEVIATTVLNAVMVDPWGLQGVVIATSIARVGANIWLGFILLRALGGWSLRSFGARVWKPLTVSFGSVLVLFAARSVLDIAQPTRGTLLLLIELAAIGAAYLLMHFGLCRASGLVEIRTVRGIPRPALSPSEWSS